MKATSKRLLSWMIVAAMVLAMVPAINLSGIAITTKAETYENPGAEIIAEAAALAETFANQTESVFAVCPVCSRLATEKDQESAIEEEVEWLPLSGEALETITFTKEDSKISHHHYYLSDDAAFAGNAITFGGGNNHKICLNLNGKTLTTGNTAFRVTYGNILNVMDTAGGQIIGKNAGQSAAVFYMSNVNAKINVYGGTFSRAADSHVSSSVVRIENLGGTFNLYGGNIDATGITGNNTQPCVYMAAADTRAATFNMYGGQLTGAATRADGGAVYVAARTTFNLYKGTISGGSGRAGGNIMVYTGALNIYGGTVSGGKSTNNNASVTGGNIGLRDGASLYMEGGVVCNGEAVQNGGNIALWYSVNTVEIVGGKIYGGVAGTNGANIYNNGTAGSALTIGGTAEIAGDIATNQNTANTLSGTPKILTSGLYAADGTTAVTGTKGYEVKDNTNLDVSGMTGGQVEVTGAKTFAFTAECENAEAIAAYFTSTTKGTKIVAEGGKLKLVEKTLDNNAFEPWEFEGQAYCPACEAVKTWTAIESTADVEGKVLTGHYYLSTNIEDSTLTKFAEIGNGNLCFNLNGKNLTMNNGRVFYVNRAYTLNIMDTEGTGVVTGFNKGNGGAVIHMNASSNSVNATGSVNIYGGTFKKSIGTAENTVSGGTDTRRSSIIYVDSYGTVTMYDGTIDAAELNNKDIQNQIYPLAVQLKGNATNKAIFDMKGGTIIGGNSTGDAGLIRVGMPSSSNKNVAAFKMSGGTIYGGGVFTDARGGNIYVDNENTVEISGGVIVGDVYATKGATVKLIGDAKIVKELTVGEQTVLAKRTGLHIAEDTVTVDVSELTAGAEVYIEGAVDVALIAAENAETIKDCIKAFEGAQYAYVKDNAFYLGQAQAAVVAAVETGYATVAEALAAYYAAPTDAYVKLLADATVELNGNAVIDANGYAVTVSGTGKLSALDASNDDYDGCSAWTVTGDVTVEKNAFNPVNSNRYIVVENEDETYGAHRIEMDLTHVTLSTANAGLYFKSEYNCDDVLAAHVGDYGVVLSVEGGVEIASVMEAAFAPNEEHAVTGASTEVYGIFKNEGRTNEENAAIGETAIKATPYITVDGKEIGGNTSVQMSLLDVMVKINNAWNNDEGFVVTDEVKAQAQAFYATWKDLGMSAWAEKLPNISAEA